MKRIIAALAVAAGFALSQACETPTFYCTDIGNTGWTCYCKSDQLPCVDMGECMYTCPVPD